MTELQYVKNQLRSQKGIAERRRRELVKVRAENAEMRAQATYHDKLIAILRLVRINTELLQEVLDARAQEESVVEFNVRGPHIR
jgi:hypothetical protein